MRKSNYRPAPITATSSDSSKSSPSLTPSSESSQSTQRQNQESPSQSSSPGQSPCQSQDDEEYDEDNVYRDFDDQPSDLQDDQSDYQLSELTTRTARFFPCSSRPDTGRSGMSGFQVEFPMDGRTNRRSRSRYHQGNGFASGRSRISTAFKNMPTSILALGSRGYGALSSTPTDGSSSGDQNNYTNSQRKIYAQTQMIIRPNSAIMTAGYVRASPKKDPRPTSGTSSDSEISFEISYQAQVIKRESEIRKLINDSIMAEIEGEIAIAIDYAKKSVEKQKSLIKLEEKAQIIGKHDWFLTFDALCNLAEKYEVAGKLGDALDVYNEILNQNTLSNVFQEYGSKVKLCIGNIYVKQGSPSEALKMYRKVMDSLNYSQDEMLKRKLLHNIAMILFQNGFYDDAVHSFEYLMNEKPTFLTAIHLLVSSCELGDIERIKNAYKRLLNCPIDFLETEIFTTIPEIESEMSKQILQVIKMDSLKQVLNGKKLYAEQCVMTCAQIIAPEIGKDLIDGYDWIIELIKKSSFSYLTQTFENTKAMFLLQNNERIEATKLLKDLELYESNIESEPAINLSTIYFLENNLAKAENFGKLAKNGDYYGPNAQICLGNVAYAQGDYEKAKDLFLGSVDRDSGHLEGLYNLGLTYKKLNNYQDSIVCWTALAEYMPKNPEIFVQLGNCYELLEDLDEAEEQYKRGHDLCILNKSNDSSILKKLGRLAEKRDDISSALQYIREAHRADPADLLCIEWLASFYTQSGYKEKAVSYWTKGCLNEPHNPRWQIEQAKAQISWGHFSKGIKILKSVHEKYPENLDSLQRLVAICTDLRMTKEVNYYQEKLQDLERVLATRARPQTVRMSSSLALLFEKDQRPSTAIESARYSTARPTTVSYTEQMSADKDSMSTLRHNVTNTASFTPVESPRIITSRTSLNCLDILDTSRFTAPFSPCAESSRTMTSRTTIGQETARKTARLLSTESSRTMSSRAMNGQDFSPRTTRLSPESARTMTSRTINAQDYSYFDMPSTARLSSRSSLPKVVTSRPMTGHAALDSDFWDQKLPDSGSESEI